MQYKITKFPYKLLEGFTLHDIQNKNGKITLTFYHFDRVPGKKIQIVFYGDFIMPQSCLKQKVTFAAINPNIGFALRDKLLNLGDLDSFQEIIFFFTVDNIPIELKCGAKNLVINEVDEEKIVFRSRKMVMPGDLNGAGTLFGGRALSWVDEESAIFCVCQLGTHRVVTVGMSEINFTAPAYQNNIVEIGCKVVRFGKTSITVKCVIRNKDTKKDILVVEEITFVSLDENGKPTPHGKTYEIND